MMQQISANQVSHIAQTHTPIHKPLEKMKVAYILADPSVLKRKEVDQSGLNEGVKKPRKKVELILNTSRRKEYYWPFHQFIIENPHQSVPALFKNVEFAKFLKEFELELPTLKCLRIIAHEMISLDYLKREEGFNTLSKGKRNPPSPLTTSDTDDQQKPFIPKLNKLQRELYDIINDNKEKEITTGEALSRAGYASHTTTLGFLQNIGLIDKKGDGWFSLVNLKK